ncbi:MAG: hypothetical protein MOGMAGMI_02090 [Candidatus Omnitrophica bacterium]|nr:hypothetical protein [Candidatus Omnitrophota bacterium]
MSTSIEHTQLRILIADDSDDDVTRTRSVLYECFPSSSVRWVKDGEELLDYLLNRKVYKDTIHHPLPHLVLLDLNMPRRSGIEALNIIRAEKRLRDLPVVILSGARTVYSMKHAHDLGILGFLRKPFGPDEASDLRRILTESGVPGPVSL